MGDKRNYGVTNEPEVSGRTAGVIVSLICLALGLILLAWVTGLIW